MDSLSSLSGLSSLALPATLLALALLYVLHRRLRGDRAAERDTVDTVAGWPPEAARVMTIDERHAFDVLRRAFPTHLVLAQVPLARFVRVPLRRSYTEWLQRVGSLSADLLLCDSGSRVVAVIDIRNPTESERARRRHERMARVLRQASVQVVTWRSGELPDAQAARAAIGPLLQQGGAVREAQRSGSMPLIPVAEMEEIPPDDQGFAATVYGPRHEHGIDYEPVSSDYFDDLEITLAKR
ncbi:MAG: DUF2726 domain-containing protein [Rubrivivax sp.]|nr:DUF2726 domain-containing protein [Rubrivivax sp.]